MKCSVEDSPLEKVKTFHDFCGMNEIARKHGSVLTSVERFVRFISKDPNLHRRRKIDQVKDIVRIKERGYVEFISNEERYSKQFDLEQFIEDH